MNLKQTNVLLLGLAFHLIFFSFHTSVFVQQTVVNSLISRPDSDFKGNAYLSLCITYTVFALSNWLAPSIISITGVKYGMILSSTAYVFYSASFLYPTTWLFYTSATLIGLGAGPLWTAQGAFLAKQSDEDTTSKNAATFWSMLQSCLLTGNIFVFFAFGQSPSQPKTNNNGTSLTNDEFSYVNKSLVQDLPAQISDQTRYLVYGVLTLVCALGSIVFLFLQDGTPDEMSNLKSETRERHIKNLNSSELDSDHPQAEDANSLANEENISALDQFLGAVRLFKTRDMLLLSTAFLFTGQLLTFFTGVFGTAIGATGEFGEHAKQYIGLAGIAIGLGEIIGGAMFGLLGKRGLHNHLRRDTIYVLGFLVLSVAVAIIFVSLPADSPISKQIAQREPIIKSRLFIVMLASVLIGFSDACFNTQIYAILMSVYKAQSVPAFALFKFMQSVGSAVAFLYSTKLDLYYQIGVLAAVGAISTLCFCWVEWRSSAILGQRNQQEVTKAGCSHVNSNSIISSLAPTKFCGIMEKSDSQQSIVRRSA